MAAESCCIAAIWSCIPFWVECMPSIMAFMPFMVSIISGIIATNWGMSESSRSINGNRVWMESVMVSTPSMVSNTDRSAEQTGMSKQCGSQ